MQQIYMLKQLLHLDHKKKMHSGCALYSLISEIIFAYTNMFLKAKGIFLCNHLVMPRKSCVGDCGSNYGT